MVFSCKKENYIDSVFWQITNPTTNRTSYVLGTIHQMDTTFIHFPKGEFKELLRNSDILCTEVDPEEFTELNISAPPIYVTNSKFYISNTLGTDYYQKLMRIVDASKHSLRGWRPYLDSVSPAKITELLMYDRQITRSNYFNENNYSTESDFIQHAKDNNIEFAALETVSEWESYYLHSLGSQNDSEKNLDILKEAIDMYHDDSFIDIFQRYNAQNLRLGNKEMFTDSIMILRNKRMTDRIDAILKTKKAFIAVGAGHLPFENGILNLLTKKGYRVKPVKINFQQKDDPVHKSKL